MRRTEVVENCQRMFTFGKLLFPRANRHDRRRKITNLWLALLVIVSAAIAAYLLHMSGR